MKKSAFTLIELLVVIAIIATLAFVALPIYGKIVEKSRANQEASHLRQLGIATAAYLADHNNQIFSRATPGGWPSVLHSKYGGFLTEEAKEVVDWKTFKSPFDKRPDGAASPTGAGIPVSYGINVNILTQSARGGNAFDGNVGHYTSPAQLIYMAPNVDLSQSTLIFIPGSGDSNVALNPPAKAPATNSDNRGTHAGRSQINVLFADYHTASINYRDFANTTPPNGSARPRWQPVRNP